MNKIFRFPFLWTFEISGVDLHSPCACQLFLVCSGMQDSVLSPNLQAPQWPQRSASKWEKKKEKPKRKREEKYPKLQCKQPAENRAEYTQLPFVQWLLRLSRSCACLVRKRGMTDRPRTLQSLPLPPWPYFLHFFLGNVAVPVDMAFFIYHTMHFLYHAGYPEPYLFPNVRI